MPLGPMRGGGVQQAAAYMSLLFKTGVSSGHEHWGVLCLQKASWAMSLGEVAEGDRVETGDGRSEV